jgi:5'-AMP-activated protein kinase catalytic alpha subunit
MLANILNTDPTKRHDIEKIRKHKWWSVSPSTVNFSNGIIVGYHRIPVD